MVNTATDFHVEIMINVKMVCKIFLSVERKKIETGVFCDCYDGWICKIFDKITFNKYKEYQNG